MGGLEAALAGAPASVLDLARRYEAAKADGVRTHANELAIALARALDAIDDPTRRRFASNLAELGASEGPQSVPHALMIGLVATRLLEEFQGRTVTGLRWMAAWGDHLCGTRETRERLWAAGYDRLAVLCDWWRADPVDPVPVRRLASELEAWFAYALHEVPSGVLYETNGATIAECEDLLEWLRVYERASEQLGQGNRELARRCRLHFTEYRAYLAGRDEHPGTSYREHLARRGAEEA